jgi:glycosyltransferase involved in cell wall biosynthesis
VTQEELDRHAPYVITTGPRRDVPVVLRLADVFAFPTEYREGVPRVLLEAALAGLPIVTTDLPGCRDVVRNGVTGLTVPPYAPKILAERILDLLRDREAAFALGTRARELVRREFGLEVVTKRHAALYAELVNRYAQQTVNRVPREPERGGLD